MIRAIIPLYEVNPLAVFEHEFHLAFLSQSLGLQVEFCKLNLFVRVVLMRWGRERDRTTGEVELHHHYHQLEKKTKEMEIDLGNEALEVTHIH